jgi:hypothetical protein
MTENASELSAPEGIRTPNLLIRSQKWRVFRLVQNVAQCQDNPISPAQTVSQCPIVTQAVSREL